MTAHAAESERNRTLAPAIVAALRASGLLAFTAPAALGGREHGPRAQLEVIEALARIDTATGWSLMISAMLSAMAGAYLPEPGVREVFASGRPDLRGAAVPERAGCAGPRAAFALTAAGVSGAASATPIGS